MAMTTVLVYLIFSLQLQSTLAIPWVGPAKTTLLIHHGTGTTFAAAETAFPGSHHELAKRDVNPNVCGWVKGDPNNVYTCAVVTSTCFIDPVLKAIGCGNTINAFYFTSCVPYSLSSICTENSACANNPSIVKCASTAPQCITVNFENNVTALNCDSSATVDNYPVSETYTGFSTIIYLPRYLSSGSVSYGTQIPQNLLGSTTSPSTTTSPTTATPPMPTTISPSTTPVNPSVVTTTIPSTMTAGPNIGAIAGGTVGGVAVCIIAALAIILYIRHRKHSDAATALNSTTYNEVSNQQGGQYSAAGYQPQQYPYGNVQYGQVGMAELQSEDKSGPVELHSPENPTWRQELPAQGANRSDLHELR